MLAKRFNKESFQAFIHELARRLRNQYMRTKPIVVIDNHTAHIASLNVMRQYFRVLRMPPYSCQFNSIEHVWGICKGKFRKLLNIENERLRRIDETCFQRIVRESLSLDNYMI